MVSDVKITIESARGAFQWAYENSWQDKMSGRLTVLNQIEIGVCESADSQLSTIKPLCA